MCSEGMTGAEESMEQSETHLPKKALSFQAGDENEPLGADTCQCHVSECFLPFSDLRSGGTTKCT